MAFKTTYGSGNLLITAGLVINYSSKMANGSWTGTSVTASSGSVTYGYMWEAHRYARMGFRYFGMTKSAANACRDAMIQKYTRTQHVREWSPTAGTMGDWVTNQSDASVLMSEISVEPNEDGSWDVVVTVNEDDVYMSKAKVNPQNDSLYFTGTRTYEDTNA